MLRLCSCFSLCCPCTPYCSSCPIPQIQDLTYSKTLSPAGSHSCSQPTPTCSVNARYFAVRCCATNPDLIRFLVPRDKTLSHRAMCHLSPSEAAVHPENKAIGTSGQRALSLQPHPEGTDSSALIKQSCGTLPGCHLAVVLGQIPAGSIKGQTPALEPAGCSMAPICSMAFGGFQKRPTPAKPTASCWGIPEEQYGNEKLSPSHGGANGLSLHKAIPAPPFNPGTTTVSVEQYSTTRAVQLKSSTVKSSLFG